jgi:hypothetical protein
MASNGVINSNSNSYVFEIGDKIRYQFARPATENYGLISVTNSERIIIDITTKHIVAVHPKYHVLDLFRHKDLKDMELEVIEKGVSFTSPLQIYPWPLGGPSSDSYKNFSLKMKDEIKSYFIECVVKNHSLFYEWVLLENNQVNDDIYHQNWYVPIDTGKYDYYVWTNYSKNGYLGCIFLDSSTRFPQLNQYMAQLTTIPSR